PLRVDADDVATRRAVVLDDRSRLALVELEPALDRLRGVVGAVLLGGPLQHAREELVAIRHLELEDDVDRAAELLQEGVERLRLDERARKAVEHEPGERVAAV